MSKFAFSCFFLPYLTTAEESREANKGEALRGGQDRTRGTGGLDSWLRPLFRARCPWGSRLEAPHLAVERRQTALAFPPTPSLSPYGQQAPGQHAHASENNNGNTPFTRVISWKKGSQSAGKKQTTTSLAKVAEVMGIFGCPPEIR